MASASFIIQEYEILKKILLNLSAKDLLVASRVCRDWERIARRIISSRAAVRWCICDEIPASGKNHLNLDRDIVPKVILFISKDRPLKRKHLQCFISQLKSAYDLKRCSLLTMFRSQFLAIDTDPRCVLFDESNLLVMLPEFQGLKLSVHSIKNSSQTAAMQECYADIWSSTASVILAGRTSLEMVDTLMAKFSKTDRVKVIGGMAASVGILQGEGADTSFLSQGICTLCVNLPPYHSDGPHYIYTDILDDSKDMPQFFKQMSDAVGPVAPGWERLGFAISCVNRLYIHEDLELQIFSRFLPGVPLVGFWSLGEFYHVGPLSQKRKHDERPEEEAKHLSRLKRSDYFRQESTCYLIITYKK